MTDQTDPDPTPGGFDIGSLISQLGQVQQHIQQAQQSAASEVVQGTSGGGSVKVTVSGAIEFLSLTIDPSVVDPSDVEMLEDLVLAAVRDGLEKATGLASQAIEGAALPDLGGPGGGIGDLFGGLFGSPAVGPGGATDVPGAPGDATDVPGAPGDATDVPGAPGDAPPPD